MADGPGLARLVATLSTQAAYAVDTEFHRERTYYPHPALVQVAWPGGVALVDPLAVDLAPLAEVFAGDAVAVAHAADQDLEVLKLAVGAVPRHLFDTQLAAGFLGFASPSLGSLVEQVLRRRLSKADRLTDWTRRPLTADQLAYAAADVEHLLDLRAALVARLSAVGRTAWAEEAFRDQLASVRGTPDPETAWWRLKDGRGLRGRARAVAQELAAWRERRAAALDRPPRFVLSDLAVVSLANRPPRSAADLGDVRGLDPRQVKGRTGEELVAAAARGLALAERDLRLPPADELERDLRPAVALAMAWVAQLAHDVRLDPALVGTRADVQALVRADPGARLGAGWRAELVGEPLRRLVDGAAAVAFAGRGRLVLEERSGRPIVPDVAVPPDDPPPDGAPAAGPDEP